MQSSDETLVAAMRILARDIQSGDGVANAAIAEAADRIEALSNSIKKIRNNVEAYVLANCDADCSLVLKIIDDNDARIL